MAMSESRADELFKFTELAMYWTENPERSESYKWLILVMAGHVAELLEERARLLGRG